MVDGNDKIPSFDPTTSDDEKSTKIRSGYTARNWKPTAVLVCNADEEGKLDKTAKEIIEALENGYIVSVRLEEHDPTGVYFDFVRGYTTELKMISSTDGTNYKFDDLNGYPVARE